MAHIRDVVGIDVSKQNLDVFVLGHQLQRTVANEAAGHDELVSWLEPLGVRVVVMEASGGYEQTIAGVLRRAGFDVRIVDPKRVRHFAKAAGRLAKNDRIDARMIAEFGAIFAVTERCEIPADAERERLASLVDVRQALIEHQTGLRNQISAASEGAARRAFAAILKPIDREIEKLDRLIAEAIVRHPPFAALAARLAERAADAELLADRLRRRRQEQSDAARAAGVKLDGLRTQRSAAEQLLAESTGNSALARTNALGATLQRRAPNPIVCPSLATAYRPVMSAPSRAASASAPKMRRRSETARAWNRSSD